MRCYGSKLDWSCASKFHTCCTNPNFKIVFLVSVLLSSVLIFIFPLPCLSLLCPFLFFNLLRQKFIINILFYFKFMHSFPSFLSLPFSVTLFHKNFMCILLHLILCIFNFLVTSFLTREFFEVFWFNIYTFRYFPIAIPLLWRKILCMADTFSNLLRLLMTQDVAYLHGMIIVHLKKVYSVILG